MIKLLSFAFLLTFLGSCDDTSDEFEVGERTSMEVERMYDAGEVMKGEVITAKFKIKNTGKIPLVIAGVKPSCSCTVPSYPKEPILPGETGTLTAKINTANLGTGTLKKTVRVTSNTSPSVNELTIKAVVMSK